MGEIELAQFAQNLTVEALVKINEDGTVNPWLAEKLTVSNDGHSLTVELRPHLKFHDGTPVSAEIVAAALRENLKREMGPVFEDISAIEAGAENRIDIKLRQRSSLVLEALETQIKKPGTLNTGTGPFLVTDPGSSILNANPDYFLGQPNIREIAINRYPSVRAAWADLLRDKLDMLYDVGFEALDSLESSSTVAIFSYVRHYQFLVLLNATKPALRPTHIRRALNSAIDRTALIKEGLSGHGLASAGPVWPKHWALPEEAPGFAYDPAGASELVGRVPGGVRFTCLVVSDHERLALALKRQLRAVGVDMTVITAPIQRLQSAVVDGNFDALLLDAVSAPSIFRSYLWWHSKAPKNFGHFKSAEVDESLDAIRHADSQDAYRRGVIRFHQAMLNDPPAIFLAWGERARAVSNRFQVEGAEAGVDMVGTMRLWRSADASGNERSN